MFGITNRELEEIGISMLTIAFAILIANIGIAELLKYPVVELAKQLGVLIITVGAGFILHEMAHKFVAQRYGADAGFRMWPMGLVMCLVFAVAFGVVFAAPGAVYIYSERMTRRQSGIISVAGPLTNIALALGFLAFLPFAVLTFGPKSIMSEIALIGYSVNGILALFNMIPIPPLDGSKVFAWNWMVWLLVGLIAFGVYLGPIFLLG